MKTTLSKGNCMMCAGFHASWKLKLKVLESHGKISLNVMHAFIQWFKWKI